MYHLDPYFKGTVNPKPIMYHLPNVHGEDSSKGDQEIKQFDPVQDLQDSQEKLIRLLEAFNQRINTHLAAQGKGQKKEQIGEKKNEKKKEEKKGEKKGDEKKKENGLKDQKGKEAKKTKSEGRTSALAKWSVKEEKVPAETAAGITACRPPTLAAFPTTNIGEVTLSITQHDIPWVQEIAKVAAKRGFTFDGKVTAKSDGKNGTIHVKEGNEVSLSTKEGTLSGRVGVAEFLGASFGLFSYDPSRSVQSTHSRRWLSVWSRSLSSSSEEISRPLSSFLSRFDTLSTENTLSLPDIVLRPYFAHGNLANNVELWAKRVESVTQ